MAFIPISINAARICDGLSRIGYTPASAICDIIDNAVRASATLITVRIVRRREASDARVNNVREYLVIDNGRGMTDAGIQAALALGSSADDYGENSLSKFGLGMKSASFSQGEVLEVISSPGGRPFSKYAVSLAEIRRRNAYGAESLELTNEDRELVAKHLPTGNGTIIRVGEVRQLNHPNVRSTLDELRMRIGAIYYYYMRDGSLRIDLDGKESNPFDVLFAQEADMNGNLDETSWDGRSTRWIERPSEVVVDANHNIKVRIEVTQLPHPPTFDLEGPGRQSEVRKHYNISAKQYGYYVYRNRRLLGWADGFDGLIPQDQDYYGFRGRIHLDDTADDVFNIDVKKSHIVLSEEARRALEDVSDEYRRKSRRAWQQAGAEIRRITGEEGLSRANTIATEVEEPDELPGAADSEKAFEEAERRQRELLEEQQARVRDLVAQESGTMPGSPRVEPTQEEVDRVVTGGAAGPSDKIFLVTSTIDNVLWEPYYDAEKKTCVRINRTGRFARLLYEDNRGNGAMHVIFGLFLLQLASAEAYVVRRFGTYEKEAIEAIIGEYRRVSGDLLAQLCRDVGEKLPRD